MIVVRDIFQLKFGKARPAKALWSEGKNIITAAMPSSYRVLFDYVGNAYTMVLEGTYNDLASYEKSLQSELGQDQWRTWYEKFIPLVESSKREIYTVFDQGTNP